MLALVDPLLPAEGDAALEAVLGRLDELVLQAPRVEIIVTMASRTSLLFVFFILALGISTAPGPGFFASPGFGQASSNLADRGI